MIRFAAFSYSSHDVIAAYNLGDSVFERGGGGARKIFQSQAISGSAALFTLLITGEKEPKSSWQDRREHAPDQFYVIQVSA